MERLRWGFRSLLHPDFDEVSAVRLALRPLGPRVMVDVGAHHGSSLLPFAREGWTVHAFEPDPANRRVLLERTEGMQHVTVDARAIGPEDGAAVTLYTSALSSGISSLRPFHSSHEATSVISTVRLDTSLAELREVTFLKVDAEGQDLPVLETFPWNRLHPTAVVCEFEDAKTEPVGYTYHDLAGFLRNRGYSVLVSEWYPVVRYGTKHRWRSLRPYPAELEDRHAWGNLIGVTPDLARPVLRLSRWRHRSGAFLAKVGSYTLRAIGRA